VWRQLSSDGAKSIGPRQWHEAVMIDPDADERSLHGEHLSIETEQTRGDEIFVVDDNPVICDFLNAVFSSEGYRVTIFGDGEHFKAVARSRTPACVILDVLLPVRSGLDILKDVDAPNYAAPFIVMSGIGGVPAAVEAIKCGALDFVEKPFTRRAILERVRKVMAAWERFQTTGETLRPLMKKFPRGLPLTRREADVLAEIIAAASNKEAARNLGISPRTIEFHRARIMAKLGAKNAVDLVRIATFHRRSGNHSHGAGDAAPTQDGPSDNII
jgi:two-component system, LuxR family, response regulator FixJ